MEDVNSSTHHHYDTRHVLEKLTRLEEDFADMKKVLEQVQLSLSLNQPKPEAKQAKSSSSLNQPKPKAKQVQSSSSLNQRKPEAKQVQSSSLSLYQPKSVPQMTRKSGKSLSKGAKCEAEDFKIFFRLLFRGRNPVSGDMESTRAEWFSVSTQYPTYGHISPVFKEPDRPYTDIFDYALSIGPYIFVIRELMYTDGDTVPSRAVFYQDTQKHNDEWEEAPPLRGETCSYCFFQANDKIYGLGIFTDLNFKVKCLDIHDLAKGWQSIYPIGDKASRRQRGVGYYVCAFKLEYKTTDDSATSENKPIATRAVIFARKRVITYNFETNDFHVSEEHVGVDFYGRGVGLGNNMIYGLVLDERNLTSVLLAFEDDVPVWCPTPVLGLGDIDNALPVGYGQVYPPARLLVIGKERLCIIWADRRSAITRIYCTKFSVLVKDGNSHATNVTQRVYKVKGCCAENLEAFVSSREMLSQFQEREDACGQVGCASKLYEARKSKA